MGQRTLSQQWMLRTVQVINWGCFDGYTAVDLVDGVNLLTGMTGAGKSSLLDANTALMQRGTAHFNRASNAATHGRARGADERNILSYMRGKTDQTRDGDAQTVDRVLRDGTVWSAIAETWRSTDGGELTAFIAYYAKPSATAKPDVTRWATVSGAFDLRDLEPFVGAEHSERPLPRQAIRAKYPRALFHDSLGELHATLWRALGIGNGGDGRRAMRLLERIQNSEAIASVNDLFTRLVLDDPETFGAADKAVEHYARLANAHADLLTAEAKIKLLQPITTWHATYRGATDEAAFYTSLGCSNTVSNTPFWWWRRSIEAELLGAAVETNRSLREAAKSDLTAAGSLVEKLGGQLLDCLRRIAAKGGDRIAALEAELRTAGVALEAVELALRHFKEPRAQHFTTPTSRAMFDRQTQDARTFLSKHPSVRTELQNARDRHLSEGTRLVDQRTELAGEREYLTGRRDLIPQALDLARRAYANATGIPVEELPFVAELLDMAPAWEGWRLAAEQTLGGYAARLLVPASRIQDFRREINDLRTTRRIRFEPVPSRQVQPDTLNSATLAGRFVFKDHAYSGWLTHQLAEQFHHVCVDSAGALNDLGEHEHGVTITGQVRGGRGGAHGGQAGHQRIIGFSPQARIKELNGLIDALDGPLEAASAAVRRHDEQLKDLESRRAAQEHITLVTWDDIDLASAKARVNELTAQCDAFLQADDALSALKGEEARITVDLKQARSDESNAELAVKNAGDEHAGLAKREDLVTEHLIQMEDAGVIGPELDRLTGLLTEALEREPQLMDFTGPMQFVTTIRTRSDKAAGLAESARDRLEAAFMSYMREWPDPNLTSNPDESYTDYCGIREGLLAGGVTAIKEDFVDHMANMTGIEMMTLRECYLNEVETIGQRLRHVNMILEQQKYGATNDGRIAIDARPNRPDEVIEFLRSLKDVASNNTVDQTYDEALARFHGLRSLIERISPGSDSRDRLLDVRRHLTLEARHINRDDELVAVYESLGEKSGGEMQELTMFIIAAALRYQVGDIDNDRPRFAPVFLDEGLVKADPETTGRAMSVWKQLNFQPIIAIPVDKFESAAAVADRVLTVSKDLSGRSRIDLMDPAAFL